MLVGPGRRDRDLRLGEHDPEGRHGVKRLKHFAAARRQHRPAHNGERDVRADLRAVRAEFRLRQADEVGQVHIHTLAEHTVALIFKDEEHQDRRADEKRRRH